MAEVNVKILNSIINDGDRILIDKIDDSYLSDALGRIKGHADVVLFPVNVDEVSKIMRYAWENQIPVTPRGAGTNLVGSTVPVEGGIVLDLTRMNQIIEFDEETMTATVEAGVVLADFQEYVEAKGCFYPPDPGEKTATIGGNISTNAGGMRAVKYGVTRDYVRGLEVVLANGEILWVGSKNVKDASGLSLKNLIVGSEGTLAIITKCILKIIPKPEVTLSVLLPYRDVKTAIPGVLTIIKENANPTAIEFIERDVIKLGEDYTGLSFPYPKAGAYILMTFDGRSLELEGNVERVKKSAIKQGALDVLILDSEELLMNVWKIRGCFVKAVEAVSEQEPVDLVVPVNKIVEFISYVSEYEKKSGMRMIRFGHAGDGNIHLCMVRGNRSDDKWEKELQEHLNAIYQKAFLLGGLTSGEHGIGLSKRIFYLKETAPQNLELMRQMKRAFDEREILNRHKTYLA
ncbi:FAD-binding oxidoreductase [Lachnoclostridium phytofermentans]|uniref:FAD linked oxidase domain protein n=1 Tax=Lachnoclostridium phytofermentans (strain ATCC 700394 / DSM 18823 / ISDg) TaxID=357809 RepID=A9KNB3_LACP7|nr:FAD-binding oxidoreductase [Lachnoclostridium phytofermentans]ABX41612.1 FAD linked oxidase domain protein [Lachnoclostridium phytofermentans ISDg]